MSNLFQTRRNEWYLQENDAYKKDGGLIAFTHFSNPSTSLYTNKNLENIKSAKHNIVHVKGHQGCDC